MSDSAFALQKAVYDRIVNDAALAALLGDPVRLFDIAPAAPAYPFVVFGDWRVDPLRGLEGAFVHGFNLRVFARHEGRREARGLIAALYDALQDAPLALEAGRLVSLRFVFSDVFCLADGETWNGVIRFRATTAP